jgi:hypothetical protein
LSFYIGLLREPLSLFTKFRFVWNEVNKAKWSEASAGLTWLKWWPENLSFGEKRAESTFIPSMYSNTPAYYSKT